MAKEETQQEKQGRLDGRDRTGAASVAERPPVERMSRHLIGLSTAIRHQMSAGLLDRGHDLRPSTAQVIPNLPETGLRISDLAGRLRLTLQRTGQLVQELEEVGYLERIPDPRDGRAKRVMFSSRGLQLIRDIEEITREIVLGFGEELGTARFEVLCDLLAELDIKVNGEDSPVRVVSR